MHNFRVNIAILNPKDNFCNWYKLNFGPLPDQVKSCHFSERINARGQYFYFFCKFLGMIGWKWLWQSFWTLIWIYYYLLNGTGLALVLDNSCWIPKNNANNNINICFFTHINYPKEIGLDLVTNYLIDKSTKFSHFSNSIPAWLIKATTTDIIYFARSKFFPLHRKNSCYWKKILQHILLMKFWSSFEYRYFLFEVWFLITSKKKRKIH